MTIFGTIVSSMSSSLSSFTHSVTGEKGVNCLQHWMRVGCCRQTCCAAARRRGRKEELVTLAQGIVYVKRILLLHHRHQKWLCYHRRGCRWRRLCTAEWATPFVARLRFDHFLSLSSIRAPLSLPLSLSLIAFSRSSRLPDNHTWFPGI